MLVDDTADQAGVTSVPLEWLYRGEEEEEGRGGASLNTEGQTGTHPSQRGKGLCGGCGL